MKKNSPPTAGTVMTHPVTTVREDLAVEKLVDLIRATHFSGYPVVDAAGRAVGLISQNDVLRALAHVTEPDFFPASIGKVKRKASAELIDAVRQGLKASSVLLGLLARPVRDLMSPKARTCRPDTPLVNVCRTMDRLRIHRLVVVDDQGKVVGLVTSMDVVRRVGRGL